MLSLKHLDCKQLSSDTEPHLGVVTLLQSLSVISLPGALGLGNEAIQAVVDDSQVCSEAPLPRHQYSSPWQVPVGDVEGGPVLSLLQHSIDCLHECTC